MSCLLLVNHISRCCAVRCIYPEVEPFVCRWFLNCVVPSRSETRKPSRCTWSGSRPSYPPGQHRLAPFLNATCRSAAAMLSCLQSNCNFSKLHYVHTCVPAVFCRGRVSRIKLRGSNWVAVERRWREGEVLPGSWFVLSSVSTAGTLRNLLRNSLCFDCRDQNLSSVLGTFYGALFIAEKVLCSAFWKYRKFWDGVYF